MILIFMLSVIAVQHRSISWSRQWSFQSVVSQLVFIQFYYLSKILVSCQFLLSPVWLWFFFRGLLYRHLCYYTHHNSPQWVSANAGIVLTMLCCRVRHRSSITHLYIIPSRWSPGPNITHPPPHPLPTWHTHTCRGKGGGHSGVRGVTLE